MKFFKHEYTLRRFDKVKIVDGYATIPFTERTILADIQTTDRTMTTDADGTHETQRLKVFCDEELLAENSETGQKADWVYFQGRWFECKSTRLSENTPLRHWTATFSECLRQG